MSWTGDEQILDGFGDLCEQQSLKSTSLLT
jgi:hypothetical protein